MTRTFETGANRNSSDGKYQYSKFINPLNEYSFAKYMHGKRQLADGTLRDGDNWTHGIDQESLIDSLTRHVKEVELLHLGFTLVQYTDEDGEHTEVFNTLEEATVYISLDRDKGFTIVKIEDVLNALRFNSEAYKLQELGYKKAK